MGLLSEYEKQAVPRKEDVLAHVSKFRRLIRCSKQIGINKVSYSEVDLDSRMGSAVIAIFKLFCDVDYCGKTIYYVGDDIDEDLNLESFYDEGLVAQINDDDDPILLKYKAVAETCPKWWL